jgi:hypothetical protein
MSNPKSFAASCRGPGGRGLGVQAKIVGDAEQCKLALMRQTEFSHPILLHESFFVFG